MRSYSNQHQYKTKYSNTLGNCNEEKDNNLNLISDENLLKKRKHSKVVLRRIHFKAKKNTTFLKLIQNKEHFNFSHLVEDSYLFSSLLHVLIRNPFISDKYSEQMHLLKGSSSVLIKSFAYLVEKLFIKEEDIEIKSKINENELSNDDLSDYSNQNKKFIDNNNNCSVSDKEIDKLAINILCESKLKDLSNGDFYKLVKKTPEEIQLKTNIIDNIHNINNTDLNSPSSSSSSSYPYTKTINYLKFIKTSYHKIVFSLIKKIIKGTFHVKNKQLHEFLQKKIKKRNKRIFEQVFSGLNAELHTCRACKTTKIDLKPFSFISVNNHKSFKHAFKSQFFEKQIEEFFCNGCDMPTNFKVFHKKTCVVFPKILCFIVDNSKYSDINNIDNSIVLSNYCDEAKVFKLFACMKRCVDKKGEMMFSLQIKYEDGGIFEFRPTDCILMYISRVFDLNKNNFYEMFFYYDSNAKVNF